MRIKIRHNKLFLYLLFNVPRFLKKKTFMVKDSSSSRRKFFKNKAAFKGEEAAYRLSGGKMS